MRGLTAITRLRKLLSGTELIHSRPEGYVLAVPPEKTDVGRFELLPQLARRAAGLGDRSSEAAALRRALGRPLTARSGRATTDDAVRHGKDRPIGRIACALRTYS